MANEDPLYIILRNTEEKEKWLYFLRAASGDAALCGSPFAILVQRMLAEGGAPGMNFLIKSHSDRSEGDVQTRPYGRIYS